MNPPSDPGASPQTKALLDYLYLISGNQTLSGQHSMYWDWWNPGQVLPVPQDQHVFNTVGKFPAVYGVDFGDGQDVAHRARTIDLILFQAAEGRIITVSYYFAGTRGDLAKIVDAADTTVRPQFLQLLDEVLDNFRRLDVAGIPLLFRPLHEMNGNWFWYGQDPVNLRKLWELMWRRFHDRSDGRNIHNVLWVFSANAWPAVPQPHIDSPDPYYPGHDFVDLLGADVYTEAGYTFRQEYHDGLRTLGANRPIANTESGRLPDYPSLRRTQPHWVYWLSWFDRFDANPVTQDGVTYYPDNTVARYGTVASDPAVVWLGPDIRIRDFAIDIGRVVPTPEKVIDGTGTHWWYESVDVKVDATPTSALDLTIPANFEAFAGEAPIRNATNRLYVQVHNRGPGVARNVKVKCLWTDASAGLPMLPMDFWQFFPDRWAASGPWHAVDADTPYVVIDAIPPRSSRVARIDWQVPPTAAGHSCILALATTIGDAIQRQDAIIADREIQSLVRGDKRVVLRNMHVIDNPAFPIKFSINLYSTGPIPRPGELAIDTHELPGGRVRVTFNQATNRALRLLDGRQTAFRHSTVRWADEAPRCFDIEVPLGYRRESVLHLSRISGIELKQDCPVIVDIEWFPPERVVPGSSHRITVMQFEGEEVQGGSSFLIRLAKNNQ